MIACDVSPAAMFFKKAVSARATPPPHFCNFWQLLTIVGSFCQILATIILLPCHLVIRSSCYIVIMPSFHSFNFSTSHLFILSSFQFGSFSICQIVNLLACELVSFSACQLYSLPILELASLLVYIKALAQELAERHADLSDIHLPVKVATFNS